ncbi:AfsR/SARP family transcriptional regulator [Asanoa siamensis]|uniref:AfsR/SARP family transcriptional regulator n=1 Tax=Asanoa siamensis TaxID=926357 RepID=UPI00194065D3|nr:BTAD domain-containing putative transcriptional regulator [Asanoa siamensis]
MRVRDQGRAVPLGTPMQVRLLALLLCRDGRPVATDALLTALWDGAPPPAARKTLQVYVHRLRQALRDPARVRHTGDGYAIVLHDDEFDVRRFDVAVEQARDARRGGDPAAAAKLFQEALGLWRGDAYAGVVGSPVLAEASRLTDLRDTVREEAAGVALDLGRPAEAAADLAVLAEEHPYRESVRGLLMLALVRAGRQADALEVYRRSRALLVDELGVEPSAALRALHEAILRGDPRLAGIAAADLDGLAAAAAARTRPTVPTPRQLPAGAGTSGFTGRGAELARLDGILRGPGPVVAVVSGIPGVGKTALAVHWGHRVSARFPDGQLYVDLRGYDDRPPLRPAAVLAVFLRSFGVPADEIPADPDEAAARYRSTLADRRVLVVLDNAGHADQVRPLLPAGAGCVALVTSRDQLSGLAVRDGAVRVPLDVLPPGDAADLLRGALGAGRVAAEPGSSARLVDLCGHLPLALRIAAAQLTGGGLGDIGSYVTALSTDRLTALQVHGDSQAAVRAAFGLSYARRSPQARRLFRLFGLVPCADLTVGAAAALTGATGPAAQRLLTELADGHLMERQRPDRFTAHDLLRVYAAERARAEETEADRRAALDRLLDHYLRTALAATRVVSPDVIRLPDPPGPAAPDFADLAAGVAWLEDERANLLALVTHAATHGPYHFAWQLTDALRAWLYRRVYLIDSLTAGRAALAAARRSGDPTGLAAAFVCLAFVRWQAGRADPALRYFSRGHAHARAAGWAEGEVTALYGRSIIHGLRGRGQDAAADLEAALTINRRVGSARGEALCLNSLAVLHFEFGDLRAARDYGAASIRLYRSFDHASSGAVATGNLAELSHLLGDSETALGLFAEALAGHRALGNLGAEASTLASLAIVHADLGDLARAAALVAAARERAGDTRYDRLQADISNVAGSVDRRLGRLAEAKRQHREACELMADQSYPRTVALVGLARATLAAGDHQAARRHAGEARRTTVPAGYRLLDAFALDVLATVWAATDPARADATRAEAAATFRATGYAWA